MLVRIPGLSIVMKFAIAAVAFIGILLEFGILGGAISTTTAAVNAVNTASATVNFLPIIYFTMIADIFAMVYFVADAVWLLKNPRQAGGGKEYSLGFKHAIVLGIVVAAIIADSPLASTYGGFVATVSARPLLQYLLPVLVLLDWLLFEQKGEMNSASPIGWLGFPAIYLIVLFVVTQIASALKLALKLPYAFLNGNVLTIPQLVSNVFMVAVIFLIVGYAMFAIDHALGASLAKSQSAACGQAQGAQMVDENGRPMQAQGGSAAGYPAARASHAAGAQNTQADQATQRMHPRMRP